MQVRRRSAVRTIRNHKIRSYTAIASPQCTSTYALWSNRAQKLKKKIYCGCDKNGKNEVIKLSKFCFECINIASFLS